MTPKSLAIGPLTIKNNILAAPLASFSDMALRSIWADMGAGLCFTEMVSAKGLYYNSEKTAELLRTSDSEQVKAVQIFGSEPDIMRAACESKYLEKFDIIDINMGCPVPKVYNNGEGSALLKNLPLAEKIIAECVKSGKIITVKTRTGITYKEPCCEELAKRAENAGASMLTLHARPREAYYSGEIDYELIAKVKNSVKMPIIANGGMFSKEDIDITLEKTGADGVMLARGIIFAPWLIKEVLGGEKTSIQEKKSIINRHIDLLLSYTPEAFAVKSLRKQMAAYMRSAKNAKALRIKIMSAETKNELKEIVQDAWF